MAPNAIEGQGAAGSRGPERSGRGASPRASRCARARRAVAVAVLAAGFGLAACEPAGPAGLTPDTPSGPDLDAEIQQFLLLKGFTGRMEERLPELLGRPVDPRLAEVGRLLFFDPVLSLNGDNSCSGCHGPNDSFNDSKSIAVGVDNNGVVGPGRAGPHNIRRAPTLINAAFYSRLMWDGRFRSNSLSPFDNALGFSFPEPEGESLSHMAHLLGAQAFTPVVAREEMTGFEFVGDHDAVRAEVAGRVDAVAEYRERLGEVFPEIAGGAPVAYEHIGAALAEFAFTLVRADAPLDRYARGDTAALTPEEKQGALLFMRRKAACMECHITAGYTNEMFSDFESHVLGVPQVRPLSTNVVYDGPGGNEDFGLERSTGDPGDRYRFRTSPLRNVAFQPSFMHNGAFLCLEDAIRHHTDVYASLADYSPSRLDASLQGTPGPTAPMVERLHELVAVPRGLTDEEIALVTAFVRNALTDPDAAPERLRSLIPETVPSGLPVHRFDFETPRASCS